MTTTAINLPLYRVLKALNVSDAEAEAAAQAGLPDLSHLATKEDLARFATKDELRAEIAGVKVEIAGVRAEIAQAVQRQTTWLFGALIAAVGVLIAVQRLVPQPLSLEAVRAIVAQTTRDMQPQPGTAAPPRTAPQP